MLVVLPPHRIRLVCLGDDSHGAGGSVPALLDSIGRLPSCVCVLVGIVLIRSTDPMAEALISTTIEVKRKDCKSHQSSSPGNGRNNRAGLSALPGTRGRRDFRSSFRLKVQIPLNTKNEHD